MTRTSFARVAVVVGLMAGSFVIPGVPAGAAPVWSVVKSPSPHGPPIGQLQSVSCGSATSCFAVGYGDTNSLVEHWNGRGWTIVKTPSPPGGAEPLLNAVSCSSATHCVAIGNAITESGSTYGIANFAERWNGRNWSIIPSPTGGSNASLSGIDCVSAKSCFAVGHVESSGGSGSFEDFSFTSLVEHWNGSTWSQVPSPNPKGSILSLLSGVSCTSATSCFAVGDYFSRTGGGGLIERWNGTNWKVVPSPHSGSSTPQLKYRIKPGIVTVIVVSGGLSGVSCSTAKSCFAVGGSFTGNALIERWNGTKWKVVPSPTPPGANSTQLAGVSCASPTDCSAVGTSFSGSFSDGPIIDDFSSDALSEHWNGTSWSITPQPVGAPYTQLRSVSCPRDNCAAVGDSAFAQHWNGTHWAVAPFTSKTSESQLIDISCDTAGCVAVGSSFDGTTNKTLVEQRVGTHWKIVPTPNPSGAQSSVLTGVSCLSATDCTAVGSSLTIPSSPFSDFGPAALVEHWNGSTWSIVPTPSISGAFDTELNSVSCTSSTSCTAVGLVESQSSVAPLIEHWDGVTWQRVTAPAPAFGLFNILTGVSCPSASSCTAVGYFEAGTGDRHLTARTLVEHWNGTSWRVLESPNRKGADLQGLFGVSCPSTTNCTAVGESESFSGTNARTVTEHWNGKKWAMVPSPNAHNSIGGFLGSVSCRGTSSCYAVGISETTHGNHTLVEQFNGLRWTVVASPNPGGTNGSQLNGVSCATRTNCTAVGSYDANDGFFTLIERGA